ncbi:MAG TPA: hypothetical protein VLB44_19020, partial [Kofleriaceae bacterium]|nr:hypothetical protein [Kofleriaceae bacterium]
MKLAAAAVVVVLAGCTDGYDVWVTYTPDLVSVRMFTSSCDLGIDFPAPGQCHSWNDGGTTEPRCTSVIEMQACTDNAHLEKDGVTVATGGLGVAN